ncbi:hypothetical protein NDU88_006413 [Pleurodeles waltl]|uniref:Uncharacterized protein n=1 Tax=Pleurodeles waltl TaxID=8319 RepID=A0AAV7RMZ6_PLEWA|nr:hypothetical protein NDU88_006413 [Pleurodeles waltl]
MRDCQKTCLLAAALWSLVVGIWEIGEMPQETGGEGLRRKARGPAQPAGDCGGSDWHPLPQSFPLSDQSVTSTSGGAASHRGRLTRMAGSPRARGWSRLVPDECAGACAAAPCEKPVERSPSSGPAAEWLRTGVCLL